MNKFITLLTIIFIGLFLSPTTKGQSLLWEISGNGLEKSSYLFGTVHLSDQRVFNFNDSVFAKIDECDAFTMEIEATPENMKEIGNSIFLEDGKTIDQMLSTEDYANLKIFFKNKLDLNLDGLKIFTPMSIVSMTTSKLVKSDMNTFVDNFLYQYAQSKNKKTFSVEPLQLQIDLMKNVPAEYLLDVANEWDTYQGITDNLIAAYAKEDMEALIKIMFSDSGFKKMEDEFIWDRNITMADSIDLFVNRQSTFVAIGTGHLPLKGGVIDLLRKKGYEVNPIIAAKTLALPEIKQNEDWITLAPEEAGFSIDMPNQPTNQDMNQPSAIGDLKINMLMCEPINDKNGNYYIVATTDYPIEMVNSTTMTPAEIINFYDTVLEGGRTNVKGILIKEGEIKLDSFLVKTVDVKTQDGALNIRFATLLLKNRMYMLQVLTENSLENNKGLERFFKSFNLKNYSSDETYTPKEPIVKEWNILESTEGNFSMMMFGKPKITTNTIQTEFGITTMNFYMTDILDSLNNELIYYAQYSDFPKEHNSDSMSTESLLEFYDATLNKPLENGKGKLLNKRMIEIDGKPAQRSQFLIFQGDITVKIHALIFLYKNRLYFLQHGTVGKEATNEEIEYFLNSFKILKE